VRTSWVIDRPFSFVCRTSLEASRDCALSFDGFLCRAFGEPAMHFRINLPMWRLRPQGSRRPYEPAKRFELVEDVFDFLPLEAASSARAGIGDPAADSDFPSGDSDYTLPKRVAAARGRFSIRRFRLHSLPCLDARLPQPPVKRARGPGVTRMGFNRRKLEDQRSEVVYFARAFSEPKEHPRD
jgi:hypothetical protein